MKRRDRFPPALGAMAIGLTLLLAPTGLRAQERPGMPGHDPQMMARHQAMMERHEQMMARMDSLAGAMNESAGEARMEAMTALLNEIVEQHRTMHEHLREAMMQRMMGHHQRGEMEGMPPAGVPKEETDGHEHPEGPES